MYFYFFCVKLINPLSSYPENSIIISLNPFHINPIILDELQLKVLDIKRPVYVGLLTDRDQLFQLPAVYVYRVAGGCLYKNVLVVVSAACNLCIYAELIVQIQIVIINAERMCTGFFLTTVSPCVSKMLNKNGRLISKLKKCVKDKSNILNF